MPFLLCATITLCKSATSEHSCPWVVPTLTFLHCSSPTTLVSGLMSSFQPVDHPDKCNNSMLLICDQRRYVLKPKVGAQGGQSWPFVGAEWPCHKWMRACFVPGKTYYGKSLNIPVSLPIPIVSQRVSNPHYLPAGLQSSFPPSRSPIPITSQRVSNPHYLIGGPQSPLPPSRSPFPITSQGVSNPHYLIGGL